MEGREEEGREKGWRDEGKGERKQKEGGEKEARHVTIGCIMGFLPNTATLFTKEEVFKHSSVVHVNKKQRQA